MKFLKNRPAREAAKTVEAVLNDTASMLNINARFRFNKAEAGVAHVAEGSITSAGRTIPQIMLAAMPRHGGVPRINVQLIAGESVAIAATLAVAASAIGGTPVDPTDAIKLLTAEIARGEPKVLRKVPIGGATMLLLWIEGAPRVAMIEEALIERAAT